MPYCNECGLKIEAGTRCPACETQNEGQDCPAGCKEETCAADTCGNSERCDRPQTPQTRQPRTHRSFCETPDTSDRFTEEERACHPANGILCYLGPLCLVPLLFREKNPYLRYHANQGLVLFLLELLTCLVVGVACAVDPLLPSVTPLLAAGSELMALFSLCLAGIGVANAASGRAKELPVIGSCVIIK